MQNSQIVRVFIRPLYDREARKIFRFDESIVSFYAHNVHNVLFVDIIIGALNRVFEKSKFEILSRYLEKLDSNRFVIRVAWSTWNWIARFEETIWKRLCWDSAGAIKRVRERLIYIYIYWGKYELCSLFLVPTETLQS